MEESKTERRRILWRWVAIGARNGLLLGVIACTMTWTVALVQGMPIRHRLLELIQDSMWVIAAFVVSAGLVGLVMGLRGNEPAE